MYLQKFLEKNKTKPDFCNSTDRMCCEVLSWTIHVLPDHDLLCLFKTNQIGLSLNKNKMRAYSLLFFHVLFLKLKTGENNMGNSPTLSSLAVLHVHLGISDGPEASWAPWIPIWMDIFGLSGQSWSLQLSGGCSPSSQAGLLLHQTFPYQFFNYLWLMSTLGTVSDTHIILFPDVSSRN